MPEGAWSLRKARSAHSVLCLASMARTLSTWSKPECAHSTSACRVLLEDALDGVGVGVRVQEDLALLGQLHHAPHHRQVGVGAVGVELADAGVGVGLEPRLDVGDDAGVLHPGAGLAAAAIGAQHRHDQVRRGLEEHLRAVVAGARHEGLLQAGLAQHLDGLGRRQHRPGVVAVVDVHVDDGRGWSARAVPSPSGPSARANMMWRMRATPKQSEDPC